MIQRRLKERSWCEGHEWPATFSLVAIMCRSFESVRQGVNDVSVRWLKASRALKKGRSRPLNP